MSSFEINKIVASVLLALIIAWVSGLLANKLIEPKAPAKNAVAVATAPSQQPAQPAGGEQAAGPEPLQPLLASANVDAGKDVAKKCAACHTFEKGGSNRVGPNLWGVIDDQIAQDRGNFAFSDALKKKGGTWTVDALNEWLWKPQAFVKGTKMTFVGLPKAKDRADMIAYLNSLSDSPKPLASQ
ncbi:MAG TPA: cytochrome c family protein [Stellaceae bacterium]|nr:cytochrome c family protein [Stellaceae bacterium]